MNRCIRLYAVWGTNLDLSGRWVTCSKYRTAAFHFYLVQRRWVLSIKSTLHILFSARSFCQFRLFQTRLSSNPHDRAQSGRAVHYQRGVWYSMLWRLCGKGGRLTLSEIRTASLQVCDNTMSSCWIDWILLTICARLVNGLHWKQRGVKFGNPEIQ